MEHYDKHQTHMYTQYRSADPKDAHFVNQAALYADLGAVMEREAFVQGTCFRVVVDTWIYEN
jgi:hypothetical protein